MQNQAVPDGAGSRGSGLSRGWQDQVPLGRRLKGAQSQGAAPLSERSCYLSPLCPVNCLSLSLLDKMRRYPVIFFSKFH